MKRKRRLDPRDVVVERLDFDLPKVCGVTLSKENIYVCLACGSYLRGKARGTPVHAHALSEGHELFARTEDATIWCVPSNYEVLVDDPVLERVTKVLRPSFTQTEIDAMDDGDGIVGLNDVDGCASVSAAIHLLLRVQPLRSFFLRRSNWDVQAMNDRTTSSVRFFFFFFALAGVLTLTRRSTGARSFVW